MGHLGIEVERLVQRGNQWTETAPARLPSPCAVEWHLPDGTPPSPSIPSPRGLKIFAFTAFQQIWLQGEWQAYLPLQVSRGEFNQGSGVNRTLGFCRKLRFRGMETRTILMPRGARGFALLKAGRMDFSKNLLFPLRVGFSSEEQSAPESS